MADYDRTGHGGALGRARPAWEDLVGSGRPRIGLPTGQRETGQTQAFAKDRSAYGRYMWYT